MPLELHAYYACTTKIDFRVPELRMSSKSTKSTWLRTPTSKRDDSFAFREPRHPKATTVARMAMSMRTAPQREQVFQHRDLLNPLGWTHAANPSNGPKTCHVVGSRSHENARDPPINTKLKARVRFDKIHEASRSRKHVTCDVRGPQKSGSHPHCGISTISVHNMPSARRTASVHPRASPGVSRTFRVRFACVSRP